LYDSDPIVTALLNGQSIQVIRTGTSFYTYEFTSQGYYELTLSTIVKINNENVNINTKYNFTIINSNQAQIAFNVPQNNNFTVVSLIHENEDITHTLSNTNELWLSQGSTGVGFYNITLRAYVKALETYRDFSFGVWINDEVPYVIASIDFGTSTTKAITLTYNPLIIYNQIGESILRITGYGDVAINAGSANSIISLNLNANQTYWVQILTSDNKLVSSYKLVKLEPLNTTAIIIIVIASIVVIALVVVFIVLRRHVRFR
jgi:hypothetical protein